MMILDILTYAAKRHSGNDHPSNKMLRRLVLDTLDLWQRTLEELHVKTVSGGAGRSRSGLSRQLETAAFAMCRVALQQIRQSLSESQPLDHAELIRICQFLEQGARTYLTALPKEIVDSPDAQRLFLSWALSMAAAWQAAKPSPDPSTATAIQPVQSRK